ncbi:MAG: septation protein IspZ [Bacteriovoracaceae bacterium]|nr:septation protein IspZ [Bacteriovoracaceae bacterium]
MALARTSIFALFSFLPAVGYAILDWYYPPHIAAAVGLGLGVVELSLEKLITHHLHALSKINFSLLFLLGLITLYARDGFLFKLQPALGALGLAGILLGWRWRKKSLIQTLLAEFPCTKTAQANLRLVPTILWQVWERDLIIFMLGYAGVMFILAHYNARWWALGKTVGLYIATALWGIGEIWLFRWLWLKYLLKQQQEQKIKALRF